MPLQQIVRDLAARNGWQPVCPVAIKVPRIDQFNESDFDGEYLVDSVEQVFTPSVWTTTVECTGKAKAKGKTKKAPQQLKTVQLKP
ncbi:phage late control protein GPD [compost metagenome]